MADLCCFIGERFVLFAALMEEDTGYLDDTDHTEEEVDGCEALGLLVLYKIMQ